MPNFIDNLVHKACRSSLLKTPEPSIEPGFEILSNTLVSTGERSPVEPSQDFPVNSAESMNASKTTSEELSSTSGIKFHASSEETFQKPLKKTSIDIAGISVQPEILKLNMRIKVPPSTSKSDHESVDFSPAVERQSSNMRDAEKMNFSNPVEQSGASTSEFGRSPKPRPGPNDTGNEFPAYQPVLETPATKKESPLSREDDIHIVNVEPSIEAQHQASLEALIKKTNRATLLSAGKGKETKTTQTQPHKEVRVNIGRIEIKASPQSSPSVKPSPRGFDDHLLMRVYLDRYYF